MAPVSPTSTAGAGFNRPALWRRAWPMALIVALHLGFFHLLQSGMLQQLRQAQPAEVVTAFLFPPAPPATAPARPPARKVAPKTVVRPPPKPRPVATPTRAPAPAPSSPPLEAPAAPVASAPASVADAVPATATTPQPQQSAAPAQPKTISAGVQYLQPPQPEYPLQSRRIGESGRVILRALVNPQGRAERVEVQQSSGFPRLDAAAREAVARALFKPYTEDGRAVAVFIIVPISFRLDQ